MTPANLAYVRQLVREQAAIVLDESKAYLIDSRLAPVARECGFSSADELVRTVRAQALGRLHQRVVEALATHETSFFRDPRVFGMIRNRLLPELLQVQSKLSIWSAACSTGQEPYSVAISLLEQVPGLGRGAVQIIASDLVDFVVSRARSGSYSPLELSRGMPQELIERYFEPGEAGQFRLKESVRELIRFQRINLIESWPALPAFNLVLLRNVLIYFDLETRAAILRRIRSTMATGGYLLLGTSETAIDTPGFARVMVDGVVTYRAEPAAATAAVPAPGRPPSGLHPAVQSPPARRDRSLLTTLPGINGAAPASQAQPPLTREGETAMTVGRLPRPKSG